LAGQSADAPDDFALMQAIAAGDRDALSILYDRHSPMVLAVCRRVLGDAAEAEDVLTDIFFEIWTRADRFDASRGCPLKYLLTIARSRSIDRRRSRSARSPRTSNSPQLTDQSAPGPNPFQSSDLGEQRQIILAALAQLDPIQRQAVECSFYEGLSHSEIAEKLQRPLGTIKTYIRQGLIRLRQSLRNEQ
jgi:RNA polymerase sigma-70 factor (ECF subfamily)